jgi:hypothetical protein
MTRYTTTNCSHYGRVPGDVSITLTRPILARLATKRAVATRRGGCRARRVLLFVVQVQAGNRTEDDLTRRWLDYVVRPTTAPHLPTLHLCGKTSVLTPLTKSLVLDIRSLFSALEAVEVEKGHRTTGHLRQDAVPFFDGLVLNQDGAEGRLQHSICFGFGLRADQH